MAQFDRCVLDVVVDIVRCEIRCVVQDDTDFLAELGLKRVQQPCRDVGGEVVFSFQKEGVTAGGDTAQQFETLPRARHCQCRALSFREPRVDKLGREFLACLVDRYDCVLVVQIVRLFLKPSRNAFWARSSDSTYSGRAVFQDSPASDINRRT